MTTRLSGRVPGFHSPGWSFLLAGIGSGWSERVRDALDALTGGYDLLRPGPEG